MSDSNPDGLGELIQAYVKSSWRGVPVPDGEAPPGEELDPSLRDRVDVLGFDSDQLLSVAPCDVLATLERLEREAAREDARITVATIHAAPSGGQPRRKGGASATRREPSTTRREPSTTRREQSAKRREPSAARGEPRARPRRRQSAGANGRAGNGSRPRGRR